MKIIIETQRLFLRAFTLEDEHLIFDLNKDPAVTRFTGDATASMAEARDILCQRILPQYKLYNMGRWATHVRVSGEFIGWCGLKYRPELDETDLGYRFLASAWGRGYATEAGRACLDYGFRKLGLQRIIGRSMPENSASVRVLGKLGMQYICDEVVDGHQARKYEALNPLIDRFHH